MAQRTLIILAIVLTGLAFVAAEADFWSGDPSLRHYHYRSTILTSFRVAHDGDIELNEAQTAIVHMAPDASLDVGERRFTSRRRLEVRPDAAGRPTYFFKVGARERPAEEAEQYLADIMQEIVRSTTIGAHARARKLLAGEGLDGLLREVSYLDSNAARRIYLDVAAGLEGLEPEQAADIIRTAGQEMTSSSRLRATLVDLAERLPLEWELNRHLAEAASRIPSSSEKANALIKIAGLRTLLPADAEAFGEAASSIPSASEKGRTVKRIYRLQPSPELAEAFLATADTIESSGERRRVLVELAGEPGLPEAVYSSALRVGSRIPSSGEKAALLSTMATVLPTSDGLQVEFIEVAGSISSSGETKRAMLALISANDLSESVCRIWIDTAGDIPSAGDSTALLIEGAARCPGAEPVWRSYLDAVGKCPSSGEQRRALMALLDRDDLSEETLRSIASTAEQSIVSSGERQAVLDRLAGVLAQPIGS